jgi:hypothetical protein
MNTLLNFLGSIWLLWLVYVLILGCYRAHLAGRLVGITKWLALPLIAIGYLSDSLINLTLASIVFLDPPKEILFTTRLSRYIKEGTDWRFIIAKRICDDLLDVFDPSGQHCS